MNAAETDSPPVASKPSLPWSVRIVILCCFAIGTLGCVTTYQNFADGWWQVEWTVLGLPLGIGLAHRSRFWRRAARTILLIQLIAAAVLVGVMCCSSFDPAIAGGLLTDIQATPSFRIAVAVVLLFVLASILAYRLLGRPHVVPLFPADNSRFRRRSLSAFCAILFVALASGGSPLRFSVSTRGSAGMSMLTGNSTRFLAEKGFTTPVLIEFRYPDRTQYAIFEHFRAVVELRSRDTNGSSSSVRTEFQHRRLSHREMDSRIPELLNDTERIICDIDWKFEPAGGFLFCKKASFDSSTKVRGTGKYEGLDLQNTVGTKIELLGSAGRTDLENAARAAVEMDALRAIMRNATPQGGYKYLQCTRIW